MPSSGQGRTSRSHPIPTHRIAVVGSINRDTIHTSDGRRIQSYGGILYTVLPLAALVESGTEVAPVCHLGEDIAEAVFALLCAFPAVDRSGITVVQGPNTQCVIHYDAAGAKQETLLGSVPPLTWAELRPLGDCDAVCLNFVTGFELSLDTLGRLADSTSAPIFMDIHSLTLGRDAEHRRFIRLPENWQAWARAARIAQMNEIEARLLAGESLDSDVSFLRFGAQVLALGCEALVVTLGASGSATVHRGENGTPQVFRTDAAHLGPVVDPTGCGDAFLAGFALAYLRAGSGDPAARLRQAARFANHVAGANCALGGIEHLSRYWVVR